MSQSDSMRKQGTINGMLAYLSSRMESTSVCVSITFIVGLIVAFTLASTIKPLPRVHDEFSYLLAADAFSHGVTSAETHPHWQHFESFHVIHQPRYASKYPPAQGAVLAFGKWLGHPIIGSCIATAFAVSAIMWMLIGWIPKSTHVFVSLLLATHPGIQVLWGQSYMGGALPIAGGALLIGSLYRISSRFEIRFATIASVGVSMLMVTRPMEGAVLTCSVIVALVLKVLFLSDRNWTRFSRRVLIPAAIVVGTSAAILLTYNRSVTGSISELPYRIHEDQYGANQLFLWQQPKESIPEYRHETIENFYRYDVAKRQKNYDSLASTVKQKAMFGLEIEYFFLGSSLVFGVFGLPFLLIQTRYWKFIAIAAPGLLAAFATPWGYPHYVAPVGSAILLLGFCGMFEIWNRCRKESTRRMLLITILLAHSFWFAKETYVLIDKYDDSWWARRAEIEAQLIDTEKKDLVLLNYGKNHSFFQEWVYNDLDIDESEVVWARPMSPTTDKNLIDYFADRRVWVVEPEFENGRLTPYERIESEMEKHD